jgi:2-polyprenyl-6-hydroxyphenyl methylase/3-demethylubiquinone-9 3-methyltransferase
MNWKTEVERKKRFKFGDNWIQYADKINKVKINNALTSLSVAFDSSELKGRTLIDVGSGSGLFSLAASIMGANVTSFDYDDKSVLCTQKLKNTYFPDSSTWSVQQGSILDKNFISGLGTFDIVYSWGVLHHTGEMWRAIDNAASLVSKGGAFYIAIYNDQGWRSKVWRHVKEIYLKLPDRLKFLIVIPSFLRMWGPRILLDSVRLQPLKTWNQYQDVRGMSPYRDVVDWVGGYPFEVATPSQIHDYLYKRGFILRKLNTVGGSLGCNEFIYQRSE